MKLDDVHSCHGQSRSIDHAANAAVQTNVVQVILAGSHISAAQQSVVKEACANGKSTCGDAAMTLTLSPSLAMPACATKPKGPYRV